MKPILFFAVAVLAPVARAQDVPEIQRARIYFVPSGSMEPTLRINDRIWASPVPFQKAPPKRGDIAIFKLPFSVTSAWEDKHNPETDYLKRVVAVPGDRVEMKRGVLWVNGQAQKEPFVSWRNDFQSGSPMNNQDFRYDMKVIHGRVFSRDYNSRGLAGAWTCNNLLLPDQDEEAISNAKTDALPTGKYLLLGDHRSNSNDSHVFGLVDRPQIKSRVMMRLYPFPRPF